MKRMKNGLLHAFHVLHGKKSTPVKFKLYNPYEASGIKLQAGFMGLPWRSVIWIDFSTRV